MLFRTPEIGADDERALGRIEELRRHLRFYGLAEPQRWSGLLRRTALARAIQGSNSIEGYVINLDDAIAAVEGADPSEADIETWQAIVGYRNAMTYVLQLAGDPHFELNEALLRSLHFMMTGDDLRNNPGKWRKGDIYVRKAATGEIVYEGPDADHVPGLVGELMVELRQDNSTPPMVRAAMAHLNLVMIHPFSDGNGRMARCLQSLVLAREGILAPQFSSVEEYLGANTDPYYSVLAEVGRGRWQPDGDARPWVRFMLTAHFHQAQTILRRIKESETLWGLVEELAARKGLPPRSVGGLFDAASGRRLRRSSYLSILDAGVSEAVASRDLRELVGSGLLIAHGEKRGRFYRASEELSALWRRSRRLRPPRDSDPYAPEESPTLF